jgi:phosphoserine phosphatase
MKRVDFVLAVLMGFLTTLGSERISAQQPLPSWNDGATRQALIEFVERVTARDTPEFVPPSARIAVFDNDGTLWSEQPMYVQLAFVIDRVRTLAPAHPEWQERQPFKSLLAGDLAGVVATGEQGLMELILATHAGLTTDEFQAIVEEWLATAKHPRYQRRYTECIYQPMRELLDYLRANGFKNYIVSGGGVEFMRPWVEQSYGIPAERVIGSSIKVKYELRDGQPILVRLPEIDFIDDKAGKPVGIHRRIGRRPILAVGNSDGDFEMLEYVTAKEPAAQMPKGSASITQRWPQKRLSLGVLVHHTDAEREFAYDRKATFGKLDKALTAAPERGWIIADIQRDWRQVFPAK